MNEELMTEQDLLDFGIQETLNMLVKKGYEIDSYMSKIGTYPNIVARKDGKLYGFLVEANEVRKQPVLSMKNRFNMIKFANKFNAIPMYASFGFGSANHEKFEKAILVKHDPEGFYCNFTGFETIDINEIPEKNTIEYKEYVVNLFALCYEKCDFNVLYKFIANNCKWVSFFSKTEYNNKIEIEDYYEKKSQVMKNTKINTFIIKFVGDFFEIKMSKVILPDGSETKNATVKVPQPNGEIGFVAEQIKEDAEKVALCVAVKFDADGLINDIYLGDPYAMEFVDYK